MVWLRLPPVGVIPTLSSNRALSPFLCVAYIVSHTMALYLSQRTFDHCSFSPLSLSFTSGLQCPRSPPHLQLKPAHTFLRAAGHPCAFSCTHSPASDFARRLPSVHHPRPWAIWVLCYLSFALSPKWHTSRGSRQYVKELVGSESLSVARGVLSGLGTPPGRGMLPLCTVCACRAHVTWPPSTHSCPSKSSVITWVE